MNATKGKLRSVKGCNYSINTDLNNFTIKKSFYNAFVTQSTDSIELNLIGVVALRVTSCSLYHIFECKVCDSFLMSNLIIWITSDSGEKYSHDTNENGDYRTF